MKRWLILVMMIMSYPFSIIAQEEKKAVVSFSAYLESYYGYDFNQPEGDERPGFVYSHNRHNEVNLNIGYVKAGLIAPGARASFALAAGTYMNANYAAEPGVLKNIFEANVGIKLAKSANLWLDAGIMPSHIGFESAISKDCRTVTRSMMADNSPYYEAGIKFSYTSANERMQAAFLWLNGWQRIRRVPGNSTPSFGTQLQYKPSGNVTLNWSSFLGTDYPDSLRKMRYFNNFYGIFQLEKRVELTAGFDLGLEQRYKGVAEMNHWLTPLIIARYSYSDKWAMAARAEYYHDPEEVIIRTAKGEGFSVFGGSFNMDFFPAKQVAVRLEGKWLRGREPVFVRSGIPVSSSPLVTVSFSAAF